MFHLKEIAVKDFVKKRKVHLLAALLGGWLFFSLFNTVLNFIITNVQVFLQSEGAFDISTMVFDVGALLFTFRLLPPGAYYVLSALGFILFVIIYYKLRTNFRELEEKHAKGSSRFTTLDEIKHQYKAVPEKTTPYKGGGGVPVSRYKDKIFIDDSPVNNMWVGTTRSGKGEMGMFPMIDIYSRAEEKASMVFNDPKGELFAASKEILEERGYHVEALNLDNPLQSMSYQVLQIVIDAYEEGNMAKAEQYAKTISSMLYSDPAAKDKFWQDSASALCTALILGLCEKNIPNHKEKITMYTVASTLNQLASDQEDDGNGKMITGLDKFFDSLPPNHAAKLQYATVKFASGAGQTVAGIFANAFDKLNIFTLTPIAKMTSQNTFDMKKVGFGKSITGKAKPLSRVNVTFPDGTASVRSDLNGLFSITHDYALKVNDHIHIQVVLDKETKDKKKKGADVEPEEQPAKDIFLEINITEINEEDGRVTFEKVNQQNTETDEKITLEKIEQFEKPTAIFMITPDYDSSLHVIASLYIKQLYTELARTASNTKGGKCIREVIFILDEFGNMPAIDDMGSIITVCLGRNIRFNLVIQAYSQLEYKYDKQWKTIDGNCANTIYILTTDNDTAEAVSKKMGERTIASHSRSGGTLSLKKSKTEGTDGRRLLTATELTQLEEGEMVVVRGIKRQDIEQKKIRAYPIYNKGKTRMKYRYEYLADQFDNKKPINDIDISCSHADVSLESMAYNFYKDEQAEAEISNTDDKAQKEPISAVPFEKLNAKEQFLDHPVFGAVIKEAMAEDMYTEEECTDLTVEEFIQAGIELKNRNKIKERLIENLSEMKESKKKAYEEGEKSYAR